MRKEINQVARANGYLRGKKPKHLPLTHIYTKINLRYKIHLRVKCES